MFGGRFSQQTVDIPLFTGLFLYSYEADFIQGILKKTEKKLARSLDFMSR